MMKYTTISLLVCILYLGSCTHYETEFCARMHSEFTEDTLKNIQFGSCMREYKPSPILDVIADQDPNIFIFLGDNVYGDTKCVDELRNKYAILSCKPEFQRLCATSEILAVWDDHDYGWNDVGYEYEMKKESKSVFLEFWQVPASSERFQHEGNYEVRYFGSNGHLVQIILLDTRTFRSELEENNDNDYVQMFNTSKTILGEDQWNWLSNQFMQPADVRIVCTSTQFGTEYNGMESWANFPLEQERMAQTIVNTQANGVLFISGDVHYAECSKRLYPNCYPLYDITSSALNQKNSGIADNQYRTFDAFNQPNFGELKFNWQGANTTIECAIKDENGSIVRSMVIPLNELQF